jgi:hypothetical protein
VAPYGGHLSWENTKNGEQRPVAMVAVFALVTVAAVLPVSRGHHQGALPMVTTASTTGKTAGAQR